VAADITQQTLELIDNTKKCVLITTGK